VPDAVEGASTTAAAFLTTVPKLGAVVGAARLLEALPAQERWGLLVAGLAAAGMVVGNLAALTQSRVRRLLGWSAVGQVGFLLAVVATVPRVAEAAAVLGLFVAGYAAANLACFAALAAEPERRTIADWRGTGRARPGLVTALGVGLLALVGTPPTGVFVAKLLTFDVLVEAGSTWLAVVVALSTLVGLAYYLRWLAACLTAPDESGTQDDAAQATGPPPAGGPGRRLAVGVAGGCATVAVLLGLMAQVVLGTMG
jgi:NADH-quinone oxidoreductase subunit N